MRGTTQAQPDFLTVVNLNSAVSSDCPLRAIKRRVDAGVLDELLLEPGAFYVMDFARLFRFVLAGRIFRHARQNQSPIQPLGLADGGR